MSGSHQTPRASLWAWWCWPSWDYSYELINDGKEVKITAYNENKAILSIPSRIAGKPVTVIGSYAFSRIGRLQNVYLPLTVKTIEDHAFYESNRITGLTIPSNVRTIGDYAFAGCNRLEWVSILNGTQSIGNYAFSGCGRLGSIKLPKSVRTVGDLPLLPPSPVPDDGFPGRTPSRNAAAIQEGRL